MGNDDWYYQVNAEAVRCSTGFIPVEQFGSQVEIKPGQVGQIRDLTIYDMPDTDIAMEMNQWLIAENERLKDEVEELRIDLTSSQNSVHWLEGRAISAGEGDPNGY